MDIGSHVIPFYWTIVLLEGFWVYVKGENKNINYFLSRLIMSSWSTNLYTIVNLTTGPFLFYHLYVYVNHQCGIFSFPLASPKSWIFGFILSDFIYYIWHRTSHSCHLLWSLHQVHHQSEELNFFAAFRVGALESIPLAMFYLILACIGVPFPIMITCLSTQVAYMFWIHSYVPRIRWLEYWVNTASLHRVHHGKDALYVNKNFASVLTIWDRLFGSFQTEDFTATAYGALQRPSIHNQFKDNFEYPITMFKLLKHKSIKERFLWLFGKPQSMELPLHSKQYDALGSSIALLDVIHILTYINLTIFGPRFIVCPLLLVLYIIHSLMPLNKTSKVCIILFNTGVFVYLYATHRHSVLGQSIFVAINTAYFMLYVLTKLPARKLQKLSAMS